MQRSENPSSPVMVSFFAVIFLLASSTLTNAKGPDRSVKGFADVNPENDASFKFLRQTSPHKHGGKIPSKLPEAIQKEVEWVLGRVSRVSRLHDASLTKEVDQELAEIELALANRGGDQDLMVRIKAARVHLLRHSEPNATAANATEEGAADTVESANGTAATENATGLPSQGYSGKLVEHKNMKTSVGDWHREFGPAANHKSFEEICAEHPGNEWCLLHGHYDHLHSAATGCGFGAAMAIATLMALW